MNRREFCQLTLMSATALSTPLLYAKPHQSPSIAFKEIDWSKARLSLKAYRSVSDAGTWNLGDIEGQIPPSLNGHLLRVGPGLKVHQQTRLRHFFDGDAFYQSFRFREGKVRFSANFIETPERKEEKRAGKMLFNEFGTMAPKRTRKLKNQPNINIIPWRKNYLALSEGGSPVMIDGKNLTYKEEHNFYGTLPSNVGFSAHPKVDETSGVGYTFGIKQGISMALMVYEMDPNSGKLKELYDLRQSSVYMIHDFMVSENYIVFLIPPAYFKLTDIIFNRGSMADALKYDPSLGCRLLILDKKKKGRVREMKLPSSLFFHHGNLYEKDGLLHFTTCQAKDDSLLEHIASWHEKPGDHLEKPDLYRFVVDPNKEEIIEKEVIAKSHDFPFFNKNFSGQEARFLYAAEMGDDKDVMRFSGVSKIDINTGSIQKYEAQPDETFGEPVFQGSKSDEDAGHLFVPGYQASRDESFLDILDTKNMRREARLWLGSFFPVGFHGNFIDDPTY